MRQSKWSLKIEQNIVNIKPAILYEMSENLNLNLVIRTYKFNKLNLDLLKSQSNLSKRLNFLVRV